MNEELKADWRTLGPMYTSGRAEVTASFWPSGGAGGEGRGTRWMSATGFGGGSAMSANPRPGANSRVLGMARKLASDKELRLVKCVNHGQPVGGVLL